MVQTVFAKEDGAIAAPTRDFTFTGFADSVGRAANRVGQGDAACRGGNLSSLSRDRLRAPHGTGVGGRRAGDRARHRRASDEKGKIVAVGTTVVRALESAAILGRAGCVCTVDESRLFMCRGTTFRCRGAVDELSFAANDLLMLVGAFAGTTCSDTHMTRRCGHDIDSTVMAMRCS
jgi:S-adenosylmethionine:tRNA ribosyltransferase-isomerase